MKKKQCFKCGKWKSRKSGFYKHPQMGDGLLGKCKACAKMDRKSHFAKNRAVELVRMREYRKTPKYKAAHLSSMRKLNAKFPGKAAARQAVSNAVRDGRLKKLPCKVCGEKKVEAHHDDYRKPLDVAWLCMTHHREIHRK